MKAPEKPLLGEHAPSLVWMALFALGLVASGLDIRLWTAATRRPAPVAIAVAAPAPPSVTPPAAPVPQPAPPVAEVKKEPVECPPLFNVTFRFNDVRPQYDKGALDKLVTWLEAHPESGLIVDGHSDASGTTAANLGLSHRRADYMARRFVAAHLPRERITRRAFGAYTPVVGAPEASPLNRRVVLSVSGLPDCPAPETP